MLPLVQLIFVLLSLISQLLPGCLEKNMICATIYQPQIQRTLQVNLCGDVYIYICTHASMAYVFENIWVTRHT